MSAQQRPATGTPDGYTNEPPRLQVDNLQVRLAGSAAEVVDDVSFIVRAGHLLGLVGESGSGKTTVALALLAYARRGLQIASGRVLLDGVDLLELDAAALRSLRGSRVAYVPQDPASALTPGLRIRTQLAETLRAHPNAVRGDTDERIRQVMAEAKLDPDADMLARYPHQLSGGQQQRVAIAMAFACRPSLIVLDEPTTGLDVTTQRHVLETVRSLCRSYGVAAVYVSHDLAVVGELVDQIAVMYAGRVVELGGTANVFREPVHPYTRGLLAAIPSPERAQVLVGIEGQPPSPSRHAPGCPFEPRCPMRLPVCTTQLPLVALPDRLVRCVRAAEIAPTARDVPSRPIPLQPAGAAPALIVRGLSAGYGATRVLEDVGLVVGREHCVAVVGESGSGKTTLARCIVGLHRSWTGEIEFEGTSLGAGVHARPKEILQRIKYVFQNPYTSLNPRKTIAQILEQPLEHYFDLSSSERRHRIAHALDEVSLGGQFARRYPDELSGGQRQRVAIARALIVEPDLLICDEVTSALDVSVQAVIVELIRRLKSERHLSVLFITHNLALVRSIAQSCVVLAAGRVVESGSVDQVLDRPQHPYTVRLMGDVPKFNPTALDTSKPGAGPIMR
jgi:peptide/nickel transport system ATP-binding protein